MQTSSVDITVMNCPRVRSVEAADNYILIVEFDNNQKRLYNAAQLLEKEMFTPLKNPTLFNAVRVEPGGFAVSWNDEIDLSEFELWSNSLVMQAESIANEI